MLPLQEAATAGLPRIPNHYFSLLLDLLARRVVNPQALVTHTFPLAEAETAFQVAVNPEEEALKVVITPSR